MILTTIIPISVFAETETEIYSDNFNSYANVDAMLESGKWQLFKNSDGSITLSDGMVVIPDVGAAGIRYNLPETLAEGKVKVEASMKTDNGATLLFELLPEGADRGLYAVTNIGSADGCVMHKQKSWGTDGYSWLYTGTTGTWYHITIVIDIAEQKYDITVQNEENTQILQTETGLVTSMQDDNGNLPNLAAIQFRNWGNTKTNSAIDNFKISKFETEQVIPEPVDDLIFEENFENMTIENMEADNWSTSDVKATVEKFDETHGNSFKITAQDTYLLKYFPEITIGKYVFTYSLYTGGGWTIAETLSSNNWNHFLGLALFDDRGSFYYSDTGGFSEYYLCTTDSPRDWVDVENIIDLDNKTITYKVKDFNGEEYFKTLDKLVAATDKTTPISGINAFRVRNWSGNPLYIDDVKLERYNPAPKIADTSVSMEDFFGETIGNIKEDVTPAVRKIKLDFGTAISKEDAETAITLTDSNGQTANYSITSDENGTVTLIMASAFKSKETYTLRVADTLKGINGKDIDKEYELVFCTGASNVMSRFADVTVNGNAVSKISELNKGDILKIKTDFVNTTNEKASMSVIITYFKDNICIKTESISIADIAPGTMDIEPQTFVIYDMNDITEVKLFLWNSCKGMLPYVDAYSIK